MLEQITLSASPSWPQLDPMVINGLLAQTVDRVVGRSRAFDTLASVPLHNDFAKAALIGACFFAAWYGSESRTETQRVRKILLTTLIASVLVLAATKTISHVLFVPRPYLQSQKLYFLAGDHLVANKRLPYRVPLDRSSQSNARELREGNLDPNDLGSFPSDHAGFFVTISLGIWLASRAVGLIALAWTFIVILASKVLAGQHSLLDIVAGTAMAATGLACCHYLARRWLASFLDRAALWTLRHGALSSAILFAVVFEVSSTLTHLSPLLALIGRGVLELRK